VSLGHNNTLNVSRAFLGAPVELDLRKAGFGGTPRRLTQQHASRAALGANPLRTNCQTLTQMDHRGSAIFTLFFIICKKKRFLNDFFVSN
jgi:hypothetical protein